MNDIHREATISPCGRYRWSLSRAWGTGRRLLWVMLNPSTADADVDDPTIRRVIAFSRDLGFAAADVANLFALRATDPSALVGADDPVGERCDYWIERLATGADAAILAWGAGVPPGLAGRAGAVRARIEQLVEDVKVLGWTRAGQPRHPLYMPADAARRASSVLEVR